MIPPTVAGTQAQTNVESHEVTLEAWRRVNAGEALLTVAKEHGIPESTLRDRVDQLKKSGISIQAHSFFWSFEGLMFLKRLVYAMIFFIAMRKSHGVATISVVLRRAGLAAFIATSYGALQAVKTNCEDTFLKKQMRSSDDL
jgi:DNA-binding Lrp family transcriptional regulator